MNRVNPLYIGGLLVFVLLFSFVKLSHAKTDLQEQKSELAQTQKLAEELKGLKSVYGDKKRLQNSLKRILRQPSLKSAGITQQEKKSGITISSKSIDKKALNSLMGKLLNGTYKITAMEIRALSDTKASLHLEIQW